MQADEFLAQTAQRLEVAGADISTIALPGGPALCGYRRQFRMAWMATTLHLFTVVVAVPVVTADVLGGLGEVALDYADSRKGAFRGLQSGVAAIAVAAGPQVEPSGAEFAEHDLVRRFAAFAWPAAFDLTTGASYRHTGRVMIGALYAKWMRQQADLALGRGATDRSFSPTRPAGRRRRRSRARGCRGR